MTDFPLKVQLPKQIAQAALPRLRQLIPCRRISVVLFDFQACETVLLAVDPSGATSLAADTRTPFATSNLTTSRINLNTFRQGQFREIEDILSLTDPPSVLLALGAEGIRSYLNAPLIVQGELIGALNLARETPGTFSPEEKESLRKIAASLAVAMQQARLYEQARSDVEQLCQRITERTAALQKANADLEAIFRTIAHNLPAPLQTIHEFADAVLQNYSAQLDSAGQQYLLRIRDSARHLDTLVQDLLAHSNLTRT